MAMDETSKVFPLLNLVPELQCMVMDRIERRGLEHTFMAMTSNAFLRAMRPSLVASIARSRREPPLATHHHQETEESRRDRVDALARRDIADCPDNFFSYRIGCDGSDAQWNWLLEECRQRRYPAVWRNDRVTDLDPASYCVLLAAVMGAAAGGHLTRINIILDEHIEMPVRSRGWSPHASMLSIAQNGIEPVRSDGSSGLFQQIVYSFGANSATMVLHAALCKRACSSALLEWLYARWPALLWPPGCGYHGILELAHFAIRHADYSAVVHLLEHLKPERRLKHIDAFALGSPQPTARLNMESRAHARWARLYQQQTALLGKHGAYYRRLDAYVPCEVSYLQFWVLECAKRDVPGVLDAIALFPGTILHRLFRPQNIAKWRRPMTFGGYMLIARGEQDVCLSPINRLIDTPGARWLRQQGITTFRRSDVELMHRDPEKVRLQMETLVEAGMREVAEGEEPDL